MSQSLDWLYKLILPSRALWIGQKHLDYGGIAQGAMHRVDTTYYWPLRCDTALTQAVRLYELVGFVPDYFPLEERLRAPLLVKHMREHDAIRAAGYG